MELQLKHLAPYLPYQLKVELLNFPIGKNIRTLELDCGHDFHFYLQKNWVRPHLHPLSDLTKEIEVNGEKFVPLLVLASLVDDRASWLDTKEDGSVLVGIDYAPRCGCSYDCSCGGDYCIIFEYSKELQGLTSFTCTDGDYDNIIGADEYANFEIREKLFEWHFDVHNLIASDLAIDIKYLNQK